MQTHFFQDFDAFADSVSGIDSIMLMQNPKRRSWNISQVDLPEIRMQLGRLGSGNMVEGQSWQDGYLLYMPLTDACVYSANGTVLEKNSFVILEPGCEFCVSTLTEHDWCSVFIPRHKLSRSKDFIESSSGSKRMSCRVTRPNTQLAHQFRMLVQQIMTAAATCSQFESAPAAMSAEAKLLKVASLIVEEQQKGKLNREGRPRLKRQEIIRRSHELLEKREGNLVLMGELAAAAGVSERTLRTAFNEYYGVGPVRYLQTRQLHQVYRALQAADSKTVSVADILVAHGVWEFSRFASRYRRLFGELPSQTLRTKRR